MTFQWMMDIVLNGLSFVAAYFDDVITHSQAWDDYLSTFPPLANADLTFKAGFGCPRVKMLDII